MASDVAPSVTIITCGKEFCDTVNRFDRAHGYGGGKLAAAREVVAEFGLADRRTTIASALRFGDPHHDPSLRSHVGCHPDILKGCFKTFESSTAVKELFLLAATSVEPIALVVYCNKNRHRSVAIGWLLASALRTDSPKPVKLIHHNARRSCRRCMVIVGVNVMNVCTRPLNFVKLPIDVYINSLSFPGHPHEIEMLKLRSDKVSLK